MNTSKARRAGIAPYVIVLLLAIFLYYKTTQFGFEAPGGRIGPDAWPRIVLCLLALVCVYEVLRRLLWGRSNADQSGVSQPAAELAAADPAVPVEEEQPSYSWVLAVGVVMTVGYVALLGVLGFFLCTVLYLAGFIRLGGYRRVLVNLVTSLLGSLAFMFVFMKVVYVSLPLGVEPFSELSFMLMRLMGIR